jgi:hypothetical protein
MRTVALQGITDNTKKGKNMTYILTPNGRKSVTQINEERIDSGKADHDLANKSEMAKHTALMKKKHDVTTKYHGSNELSYHGKKKDVKRAIVTHYGDANHAKEMHPHVFEHIDADHFINYVFENFPELTEKYIKEHFDNKNK